MKKYVDQILDLNLSIGDLVLWKEDDTTNAVGEIVGLCRECSDGARNALMYLVQFTAPHSFAEPFVLHESQMRRVTPLEALAEAAE